MTTNHKPLSDQPLFEIDGLFATVDTIPTTPIDELTLPREIPAAPPERTLTAAEKTTPAERREMFHSFGWTA